MEKGDGVSVADAPSEVPQQVPNRTQVSPATTDGEGGSLRRFRLVSVSAIIAAAIPYLWVLWSLWTGTVNPFRVNEPTTAPGSVEYDAQARALMHGHLSLPPGSIGIEAFIHHGRTYTYFGIFPSLIRIPVLLFTHSLDGRLNSPSLLLAWLVTALFTSMLVWRLRVAIRGEAALGWTEAVSYGLVIFSTLAGSVLVSLASNPEVYAEDEAWGVALTCASLFALVGVVEKPSWRRVTVCGVFVLLTNLNRSTTGYACILGTLAVGAWFALGWAGSERRRWAVPVLLAGFVPLVVGCAIDFAKFNQLFGFPASEQLLYKAYQYGKINGGKHFSLRYLPATLQAYLSPGNLRLTSVFPYLTVPDIPRQLVDHTQVFNRGNTSSAPASMPLLFLVGLWGVVATFGRHRPVVVRSLRILLVAAAASAGAMLIYGTIYERFLGDFLPLLVLAGSVGMIDIWHRLDGARRPARTVVASLVCVLALFGFVANMGIAVVPQGNWNATQVRNFVHAQQVLSDVTGHPLSHNVVQTNTLPLYPPLDQLWANDNCQSLSISDGGGLAYPYPRSIWLPVKTGSTSLCRSLTRR
jgi:hypothetical protein